MPATDTKHTPSGFSGIKHAKKPTPGTASAPEARAKNASFDHSPYQNIVKSLKEGKLR